MVILLQGANTITLFSWFQLLCLGSCHVDLFLRKEETYQAKSVKLQKSTFASFFWRGNLFSLESNLQIWPQVSIIFSQSFFSASLSVLDKPSLTVPTSDLGVRLSLTVLGHRRGWCGVCHWAAVCMHHLASCCFWSYVDRIRNRFTISYFYSFDCILAKRKIFLSVTRTSVSHGLHQISWRPICLTLGFNTWCSDCNFFLWPQVLYKYFLCCMWRKCVTCHSKASYTCLFLVKLQVDVS